MRAKTQALSAEDVRALLDYDPETGIFRWKSKRGNLRAGSIAGSINARGYVTIRVNFVLCYAHRLAWLVTYGVWPEDQIDHIDCDKSNNKISNLREATNSENQVNQGIGRNNTSGRKGVSWNKEKKVWEVRARFKNHQKFLGYFDNLNEASSAYNASVIEDFGEFARTD